MNENYKGILILNDDYYTQHPDIKWCVDKHILYIGKDAKRYLRRAGHHGGTIIFFFAKNRYIKEGWGLDYIAPHEMVKIYNHFIAEEKVTRCISKSMRYQILRDQHWECNECSIRLKFDINSKFPGEVAHIDHIHPFAMRGTYQNGESNINERSNLQALCPSCNNQKRKAMA